MTFYSLNQPEIVTMVDIHTIETLIFNLTTPYLNDDGCDNIQVTSIHPYRFK